MTEDDLDARDAQPAPLLELLVVGLAVAECVVVTLVSVWLWG